MKRVDIGELAALTGTPPSTLRYYEEIGLLRSVGRHGLRRQYNPEAVLQLQLIALGKGAGFSLTEIAAMFGSKTAPQIPRPALLQRADDIDRHIDGLKALRDMLRHVAECPAPDHLDCPRFQKLLRASRRTRRRPYVAERVDPAPARPTSPRSG